MELGGKVSIQCEKTGYRAELEFKLKVGQSCFVWLKWAQATTCWNQLDWKHSNVVATLCCSHSWAVVKPPTESLARSSWEQRHCRHLTVEGPLGPGNNAEGQAHRGSVIIEEGLLLIPWWEPKPTSLAELCMFLQESQVFWSVTPEVKSRRLRRYTVPIEAQGDFESER